MAIREAEVAAFLVFRNAVELVFRSGIAGPVAAIVGEPQLLGHRMPVEADGVADAARDDLHAGSVGVVAADLPWMPGLVSQMLQFEPTCTYILPSGPNATYFQLW